MKLAAKDNLYQLRSLLTNLSGPDYTQPLEVLSGASIGQHIRHILEFYKLLITGAVSGRVSYDKRERDTRLENDTIFAVHTIDKLIADIDILNESLPVKFETGSGLEGDEQNSVPSSVGRELSYCIEHSIHHQALIKAGLMALGLKNLTNEYFGVARSTLQYRNNACAQ